jgi:toxin ParE1/3/4
MKRRVTYRPEALAELKEIAAYTRRTWSAIQAKRYTAALATDIKALRTSAKRYPTLDPVHPGLRRKRSAMHHIYYLTFDDRIEIIRIIHVQRDPGLHLKVQL